MVNTEECAKGWIYGKVAMITGEMTTFGETLRQRDMQADASPQIPIGLRLALVALVVQVRNSATNLLRHWIPSVSGLSYRLPPRWLNDWRYASAQSTLSIVGGRVCSSQYAAPSLWTFADKHILSKRAYNGVEPWRRCSIWNRLRSLPLLLILVLLLVTNFSL